MGELKPWIAGEEALFLFLASLPNTKVPHRDLDITGAHFTDWHTSTYIFPVKFGVSSVLMKNSNSEISQSIQLPKMLAVCMYIHFQPKTSLLFF